MVIPESSRPGAGFHNFKMHATAAVQPFHTSANQKDSAACLVHLSTPTTFSNSLDVRLLDAQPLEERDNEGQDMLGEDHCFNQALFSQAR